jgi:hypothetical protein
MLKNHCTCLTFYVLFKLIKTSYRSLILKFYEDFKRMWSLLDKKCMNKKVLFMLKSLVLIDSLFL